MLLKSGVTSRYTANYTVPGGKLHYFSNTFYFFIRKKRKFREIILKILLQTSIVLYINSLY